MKLKLDFEIADQITAKNLKNALKILKKEVKILEKMKLKPHQQEDLEYNLTMIHHLEAVISYFE